MASIVTPPYSVTQTPPPTDDKIKKRSAVQALVEICKECQRGKSKLQPWTKFDITREQWAEFHQLVQSDEKLR